MDNEDALNKAKEAVRYKLLLVYQKRGLHASLEMADKFLKDASKAGKENNISDFGKIVRGELSEIYAEVCLREYVKTHKNSFYTKSLCFPRADGKEGFTEIDLALFSNKFVMLIECKSYSGQKTLTNEGCMNVKGRSSYNVFSQNRMHLVNLDAYIRKYRLASVEKGGKPYQLCMFSYSKDPIEDLRTDEWKSKFHLFTEESLLTYLNNLEKSEVIWDIKKLYKCVGEMQKHSEENMKKHIEISKRRQASYNSK